MTELYIANGCKFLLEHDVIVAWERKERRKFEPETFSWLLDIVECNRNAGTFVDVGASTGWYTVPAAKLCPVVAFEPMEGPRTRLRHNLALNGVGAQIIPCAASDRAGKSLMWHDPRLPLTSGASLEVPGCAQPAIIEVDTVTVDEVIGERRIIAMKVDVEGHELKVLKGSQAVIEASRPPLVLEANDDDRLDALAEWLSANGYDWRHADGRNLLCSPL